MNRLNNQSGAIAVITAIMLTMLLGFVALSIDTGHLVVTKNELQNAADAGALAGARELYSPDGSAIQNSCNQTAYDIATSNLSEKISVEVNWVGGNAGDIERGHWSFGRGNKIPRGFYPSASLVPVTLWGVSLGDLDDNLNFINAVRVTTRREATPIASYFANLFGYTDFKQTATAVGYIGFAGSFEKYELDQPIAICYESVTSIDANGNVVFDCNNGRMINSGTDPTTSNSGGWTDFDQSGACSGVNSSDLISLMTCDPFSGNLYDIVGGTLETGGGQIQSVYDAFSACWELKTNKIIPWKIKLPVVMCPGNNVGNCSEFVGGIVVEIVWITGGGTDPSYSNAPTLMDNWSSSDLDGKIRWASFVNHFGLKNVDGSDAIYAKKSIYFKPSCDATIPSGGTGGLNLGVLARIPVLVG